MEQISGCVAHIIYHNENNAYTVFELESDGEEITCTGTVPSIREGESCRVTGEYVEHPTYGRQLRLSSWEAAAPEDREAVFRYLSSGAVKGIGEALAGRILRLFGDETMRILDEEPERLAEVKGISQRMAREIAAQVQENREQREAFIFLQKYGISGRQAVKIYETYKEDVYTVLRTDPYRLAEDVHGIGFLRADEIAARAGIQADSDFRIRSGILYVLSCAMQEGSCYLPGEELCRRAAELLGVARESLEIQLGNLAIDGRIRILNRQEKEPQVYLSSVYHTEQRAARRLLALDAAAPALADEAQVQKEIEEIEGEEDILLDALQREAVTAAAGQGVLLVCGGPGTGKTTTINTMLRFFRKHGCSVLLAAPTGRAARRMTEATGWEAMTIHRLLGYQPVSEGAAPGTEEFRFEHDERAPLEGDVVIVDEMSMVDLFLFDALLAALSPGTRLVMVGDVNQLPSIGPGRVLGDLIDSGAFKTVMLHRIFRQAAESDIVMNAHRILQGIPMVMDNHSRDFFLLERTNVNVIYKHICILLSEKLPPYLNCSSQEIQVLSPMKKGPLGTVRLNEVLQSVLNPPEPGKREYLYKDTLFREGDKVMQTRNNYQISWEVPGNFNIPLEEGTGIFNGDSGVVETVDEKRQELVIRFDDNRVVHYPFAGMDDLELAYAITVHKSQGSEYPGIILPITGGPRTLFNRSLLYTAITRAKHCVVILGSRSAVDAMEANQTETVRYTGLEDRIHELGERTEDDAGRSRQGTAVSPPVPGV